MEFQSQLSVTLRGNRYDVILRDRKPYEAIRNDVS